MSSIRERIIVNRRAALDGEGKPTGVIVHRNRIRPIERDELPAYVVYMAIPPRGGQSGTTERLDHDTGVERRMNLRIEIRVTAESPDAALDEHYVHVIKAMRADPTCGGLALDCEEVGDAVDAADLGRPVGANAVDFEITYLTDEDDPEQGASG